MRIFEFVIGCYLCGTGNFCGLILLLDSLLRDD